MLAGHSLEGFPDHPLLVELLAVREPVELVLPEPLLDEVEGLLDRLVVVLVALVEHQPDVQLGRQFFHVGVPMDGQVVEEEAEGLRAERLAQVLEILAELDRGHGEGMDLVVGDAKLVRYRGNDRRAGVEGRFLQDGGVLVRPRPIRGLVRSLREQHLVAVELQSVLSLTLDEILLDIRGRPVVLAGSLGTFVLGVADDLPLDVVESVDPGELVRLDLLVDVEAVEELASLLERVAGPLPETRLGGEEVDVRVVDRVAEFDPMETRPVKLRRCGRRANSLGVTYLVQRGFFWMAWREMFLTVL